jgi:hypothetical protein
VRESRTVFGGRTEDEFHAACNSELLVNPDQVIANRVLGKTEFMGDLSVAATLDGQFYDVVFSFCEGPSS